MPQLQVINHNNQRVLMTAQLAESYGADRQQISYNFNQNKDRYSEGKHYIALQGDEKREFLDRHEIHDGSKNAAILYLWTEKGAWMQAKSLNTDEAWSAYEMLVDDYYSVKQSAPSTTMEFIAAMANQAVELERRQTEQDRRLNDVEHRLEQTAEILALNPTEWRKKVNGLLSKIAQGRDGDYEGVRRESYQMLEERGRCKLATRQDNIKKRMALEGTAKSKIDKVSKMDAIANDAKLTEIYLAVVKEMAIKYKVDAHLEA